MRLYTETARIISRRAINRVGILNTSVNYRKATYHYSGLPTMNLFYEPTKESNYNELSFGTKFNLAYEIMIRYSHIASIISVGMSLLFFVFSVFMIGYVIASYIIVQNIASGWTTTMMFLTISFSGLFLVLSMILKYLDMLLRDRTINKSYVYDTIEQIKTK
jgi:dolichol-phosphate mannosyltransferase